MKDKKLKHEKPTADESLQSAINAMAQALYRIKCEGKVKAEALAKFVTCVDTDEASFLEGRPFEFTEADAVGERTLRGKLRLRHQRVWELEDIEVSR